MKRFWPILATVLGLAIQAVPASAAVQYTLNCTTVACTGAGSGNYGTVKLTDLGSGKINVSVSLASGFSFGNKDLHLFLWNGTGDTDQLTASNITSNASTFSIEGSGNNGTYTPPSPFNATGAFDYSMTRGNNAAGASTLSFDLTKSGGLALANFATTNDGGAFYFGALIKGAGDAFFVAANQAGIAVPEPGTWTMAIAGLMGMAGLVMLRRRRKLVRA